MNDSDNNNPDRTQSSSINTTELKINRRSLDVYKQYLRKTTQSLAHEQLSDDLSDHSAKSLSDDEKAFFDNFSDTLRDSPLKGNNVDVTDQIKTVIENKKPVASQIDTVSFREKREISNHLSDNKPSNNFKLITIVASFCVLLLVGVMVIVFNANNNLVALTDRLSSVNNQMSAVNDNISVIGQENSLANAKAVADERAADAKNAASLALVKQSLDNIALNTEPVKSQPVATRTTRLRSMKVGEVNIEPTISYDDFKNESQVTVYREATN